jgi:hypothetical protein
VGEDMSYRYTLAFYACVLVGLAVGLWSGFELWTRVHPILALLTFPVWGAASTILGVLVGMIGAPIRVSLPESCWRCTERSPIPEQPFCAECVAAMAILADSHLTAGGARVSMPHGQ